MLKYMLIITVYKIVMPIVEKKLSFAGLMKQTAMLGTQETKIGVNSDN